MISNRENFVASAFASPAIALAALVLVLLASLQPAKAQTLTPLHDFVEYPQGGGLWPQAGLVMDAYGNLYGTTFIGGAHGFTEGDPDPIGGDGTVFKVTPNGSESLVYSFGAYDNDGVFPASDLVVDREGNLYGTTELGGSANDGIIFKIDKSGAETVLHSFSCSDGAFPVGGLVMDREGNLYGTANEGGSGSSCTAESPGNGVVFKLGRSGEFSVLHDFAGSPADASHPADTLLLDREGNLYGTAGGGEYGDASIFKLTPDRRLILLHSFGSGEGEAPGRLIRDLLGNLYGVMSYGEKAYFGTVFKLQPDGNLITLHTFQDTTSDGSFPTGGLVMDMAGNLFGTTSGGGTNEFGTLFKIDREGKESILYNFGDESFNSPWPGQLPNGDLMMDWRGNIYGTCRGLDFQEAMDQGTVFKFGPDQPHGW